MKTTQIGQEAETQAAAYLSQKGYTLRARNFSTPEGEIDLICQDKQTLVFVEVKARAYEAFGGPLAAVTPAKQKRIMRAAVQYVKASGSKFDSIRFDVVCVLPGKTEHIVNAFVPQRTTL